MATSDEPDAAPDAIRSRARAAVGGLEAAVRTGLLPALPEDAARPAIGIERPSNPAFGDLATNLAMQLARPLREATARDRRGHRGGVARRSSGGPHRLGRRRAARFREPPDRRRGLRGDVDRILAAPADWGRFRRRRPASLDVEFVSANPTGPLHIGNARGAFVGDLLCRVLEAGGQTVTREYYFNDFGAQVRKLGASVLAIRAGTGPRGRLPRRLRRRPRRARCPTTSGPPPRLQARTRAEILGRGHPSGCGRGSRRPSSGSASTSTSGSPRARCTPTAGSTRRSSA